MPRSGEARRVSSDGRTRIVQPRVKNLKPITKFLEWHDLPSVPNETGKDTPLEFAQAGKVVRLRGAG